MAFSSKNEGRVLNNYDSTLLYTVTSLSHSTKPIFLRFIVFFTVHLLNVSNGETETELLWGSWVDQPVRLLF